MPQLPQSSLRAWFRLWCHQLHAGILSLRSPFVQCRIIIRYSLSEVNACRIPLSCSFERFTTATDSYWKGTIISVCLVIFFHIGTTEFRTLMFPALAVVDEEAPAIASFSGAGCHG